MLEVYTNNALPYSTIVDCARRFRKGRESIEDEDEIERPVSAASDKVILEVSSLVEEDPHITLARGCNVLRNCFQSLMEQTLGDYSR